MKHVKNYIEQESGRSMVEMLGVLAIIGVLSVGGISGYTTAMNKHKANEILNAAAVRAMAVSTQLQNGSTSPTLDEFPTGEVVGGATFGGVTTSGDKFTIALSNLDLKVKSQMENIIGDGSIVRAITSGGLTYNDDLSTDVRASDFDNDEDHCVGPKYHLCSGSDRCLDVGTDCNTSCSGTAPTCKSACDENGAWVVGENDVDKPCKLSPTSTENDGVCNASGVCEEQIAGKKCQWASNTNNTQCGGLGSGYYCNLENKVTYKGEGQGTDGMCFTFSEGTCQAVGGLKDSGNYTNTEVNWYTGYSFCQGLDTKTGGMSMVTGRGSSGGTHSCDFDYGSCEETISPRPSYYWLDTCTDDATSSCGAGSCFAFGVDVGYVDSGYSRNRGDDLGSALCE